MMNILVELCYFTNSRYMNRYMIVCVQKGKVNSLAMEEKDMQMAYDENQIQVLEGLEAVRKRPGMYIGTTSSRGLHHLVWEIVDNSIDEALAGYCDHIEVTIEKDNWIRVDDNGRGIPVGTQESTGTTRC